MVRQDGGLPGGRVDVGVDLGGEDGLVAEHFLDDPQVRPAFDEVGGERVAEGVRGDLLVDARSHRLVLHDVEDVDAAEGFPGFVEEKDVLEGAGGGFRTRRQVVPDSIGGHFPEGDDALLVPLAHDIDITFFQVDMRDQETGALAHAEAAAVQDFQDGAVPQARRVPGVHRGDDGIDLLHRQDGGEVLPEFGGVDAVAGVVLQVAFLDAPVEEGPEGTEHPGLGALGQAFLDAFREITLHFRRADVGRTVSFIRRQESLHVPGVGCHRVRRHPALDPQVVAEILGEPAHQRVPYLRPYSSICPR